MKCGRVIGKVRYAWYPLLAALAAGWVLVDARRRMAPRYWTAAVALGGPLGLATYLALRPLHEGESREGGRAWQFLSKFVVVWTALLAFAALWNVALPFADLATIGVAWALVALPALVVGIALKRSTTEHGPTGCSAARALASWPRADSRWARLHLPRMRQGISDRTAVLRRLRRLAGRERLNVTPAKERHPRMLRSGAGAQLLYFTAMNATSTSTSRGKRATCTVARPAACCP